MSDPFDEEQQNEELPVKEKKGWKEIKAAYWKSPWYANFKFVHWKDVVIFALAIILITNTWVMHNEYKERIDKPCDYCPFYKPIPGGGAPVWNEVNGTFMPTVSSNTSIVQNQESQ